MWAPSKCQLTKALPGFGVRVIHCFIYSHHMVIIIESVYTLCVCVCVSPPFLIVYSVLSFNLLLNCPQSHIQEQTIPKPPLTVSVITNTCLPPQSSRALIASHLQNANASAAPFNGISRGQHHRSNTCHCIVHTVFNPLDPAAGLLSTVFIYPDFLVCVFLRCLV